MRRKTDMWRTVCSLLCLAAICVTLTGGMTACSQNSKATQKQLFAKGILTENNLTFEDITKEHTQTSFALYYEIDGLKNQAVEDTINRRIREVFDLLYSDDYIPPYRGISVKLRQYQQYPKSLSVGMYSSFNSNNILSIVTYCYVTYSYEQDDNYDAFGYGYEIPLNFDLTTGEELTLKDLFAADTDYLDLLNRAVDEKLLQSGYDSGSETPDQEMPSETVLTSPFKGIKPSQKFCLGDNGDICLVMDYDTPEFYTGFYPDILSFSVDEFGDALELFRLSKGSIYDSDETVYQFMVETADQSVNRTSRPKEKLEYYGEYRYRDGTPEAVLQRLNDITFGEAYQPTETEDIYEQMVQLYGDSDWVMNVTLLTYGDNIRSPDYFSASRSCSMYAYLQNEEEWDDPVTFEQSYQTMYCFDRKGNPVAFADLFAEPEKAQDLAARVMTEHLLQALERAGDAVPERAAAERYVQKLLPYINGVSVSADCLYLSFDLPNLQLQEITADSFDAIEGIEYLYIQSVSTLPYRDIGCENLVIFDINE